MKAFRIKGLFRLAGQLEVEGDFQARSRRSLNWQRKDFYNKLIPYYEAPPLILNHSQRGGVAGGYRKTNTILEFNKKYHQCDRMRFRVRRLRIEGLGWNRIEPTG